MPDLALFAGALAIAYLVPGPDMLLLLQTGALRGCHPALMTAIGLGAARGTHVLLAGLGLAALLRTSPFVFEFVRIAGAGYLAWLGFSILRTSSLVPPQISGRDCPQRYLTHAMVRGFLTNLLNPKALLFCSVLLPQFLDPAGGSLALQFLLLGMVLVAIGVVFDLQYALAGNGLGVFLARRPFLQRVQRWLFGSVLIGFGIRLLVESRN